VDALTNLVTRGQEAYAELMQEGNEIQTEIDAKIAKLFVRTTYYNEDTLVVYAETDSYLYISELGDHLLNVYANCDPIEFFVVLYYNNETTKGKYKLSLRSSQPSVDVSVIAKTLGGGGHCQAAGCMVDALPWGMTTTK
jgi:nanoRNase/pAp phosphatase (c-di-AMP/oligoRNAs hydrolase)